MRENANALHVVGVADERGVASVGDALICAHWPPDSHGAVARARDDRSVVKAVHRAHVILLLLVPWKRGRELIGIHIHIVRHDARAARDRRKAALPANAIFVKSSQDKTCQA